MIPKHLTFLTNGLADVAHVVEDSPYLRDIVEAL